MKALVYRGPGKKEWIDVEKPQLQKPTDVIVKVVKTTICGTDLHILKGDVPAVTDGRILGHEGVGIVEEVGDSVTQFKKGDKVIISAVTACGSCYYCKKQLYAHCEDGGWILGHLIDGTQAEYVRIPHADNSLHRVPDGANDEALVMLSDILPTSFEIGTLSANVNPGDTVAIVGAGPIGLAAVLTAQFYSPAEIIMIDLDDNRLQAAKDLGATASINSSSENVLERIHELTDGRGVDVAMEAVGIPATFELCQKIISPGARIANIGVHGTKVDLHLEELWIKNISITTGLVSGYSTPLLLKTVESGKVQPEKLITHHFEMDDMLEAYEVFGNAAQEGTLKVIISNDK
ncbi:zinc-dependent alcohol dehydrogenase family protein [Staphylococcus delphini]|uniref:zinc-dependent alcohol dehydrogenase family protein n=1 Tax=Staphylococcus delphini TaxID=53344 RepID=UPI0023B2E998|nr:zinc-dependent alcohol dehydrogenase family protein [Staphylococcus delphini]MDE9828772.1 zinc-dependent alcohol dehydrogenase family protein [Staphylococcus delphini]